MMRLIIALVVAFVGCRSPESWVRLDNGKDPVLCYAEYLSMIACRDSTGLFWICDHDNNAHCMRVDMPATLFAVKPPTPAEAAPR
jgi:hypothetical protein